MIKCPFAIKGARVPETPDGKPLFFRLHFCGTFLSALVFPFLLSPAVSSLWFGFLLPSPCLVLSPPSFSCLISVFPSTNVFYCFWLKSGCSWHPHSPLWGISSLVFGKNVENAGVDKTSTSKCLKCLCRQNRSVIRSPTWLGFVSSWSIGLRISEFWIQGEAFLSSPGSGIMLYILISCH